MSSLDHRGSAPRRDFKQQQPQQQLPSTPLAFRRAQLPSDRDYFFDPEHSRIPTPASSKHGVRPRSSFSKTRTLKDAFEATSRVTAMDSNEGHSQPISIGGRTPSPSSRRQRDHSLPSPLAEAHSPPPGELLETYQRINDADDLADLVSEDDLGGYSRRSSKERRKRESSGSRDRQKTQLENGDNDLALNFSYLNDDSQRGNLSTYKRDEERLRQATASQLPIFSRANVGTRADDLQRREVGVDEVKVYEAYDGPQPALNVPRSWGNKSKSHRQWLSSMTRQNKTPRRGDDFERKTETTLRDASRSRSPNYRLNTMENVPIGDAIPNTPVVVYKGGYRDRPQAMRSDSRDLLRRLARTESPPQTDTPEPKRPVEQLLPDKTPVVIGAWVDTPVTVRPTQTNDEDFTREIESPSKSGSEIKRESTKTPTEKDTKSNDKSEQKPEPKTDATVEKKPSPELAKPKLPKSALESVIEDAKSNGNPLHLGEDTINSLQGLMDGSEVNLSRYGDLDDQDIKEDLDAIELEENQLDSEKDLQSVDRLSTKIQSIIHSIHDARNGLDVLADTIAPDIGIHSSHKNGKPCKACGNARHSHSGERVYVAIPIPRLWYRTAVSQRLRLTYFGWGLIFLGIWYISECLMCDQFCHPTVAEVCDGYCLQPDAPEFPLTIPTMLWRWSHLSSILSPIITVFTAFIRLIAQILGLWDGYVDDNPLSESNSSLGDIAIGGSYGIKGLSGLWSRSEKDSPPVLTSSAAPSVSLPTPLQQVVEGYQVYGRASEGQGAGSMDDDETL